MERNRTIVFTKDVNIQGRRIVDAGTVKLAVVDGNETVKVSFPGKGIILYCVKGYGTDVPRSTGRPVNP